MSTALAKFIRAECVRHPAATEKLVRVIYRYRRATGDFTTRRFEIVEQLTAAGFQVARGERQTLVIGLSLGAPEVVAGHLVDHAAR